MYCVKSIPTEHRVLHLSGRATAALFFLLLCSRPLHDPESTVPYRRRRIHSPPHQTLSTSPPSHTPHIRSVPPIHFTSPHLPHLPIHDGVCCSILAYAVGSTVLPSLHLSKQLSFGSHLRHSTTAQPTALLQRPGGTKATPLTSLRSFACGSHSPREEGQPCIPRLLSVSPPGRSAPTHRREWTADSRLHVTGP